MRWYHEIVGKYGEKMRRLRTQKMNKKVVELFDEKTGGVIRTICFRNPKMFDEFLIGFQKMRYPGLGWRYKDKARKTGKNTLVDHSLKPE